MIKQVVVALVLFSTLACDSRRGPVPPPKDVVLTPGDSISISNGNGTVVVEWEDVASRHFTYKGTEWDEPMTVREYVWYDHWGIYSAGDNFFDRTSQVGRLVYEESCVDFDSEEKLKEYMDGEWNKIGIKYVWSEDGLVGGLSFTTERKGQLNVDLWKITVRGQVPKLFQQGGCEGGVIEFVTGGE